MSRPRTDSEISLEEWKTNPEAKLKAQTAALFATPKEIMSAEEAAKIGARKTAAKPSPSTESRGAAQVAPASTKETSL